MFYFIKALLDTGVCTYICFKFSVLVYSFRMRTKLSCVSTMECLYMYVVYIEIYNVHKLINERIVEVCTAHKNRISQCLSMFHACHIFIFDAFQNV